MYVYALDTPLSRHDLSNDLLEQSKIYGTSMLKLAILLGWSPILSENQIVDSTLVLSEAGQHTEFVKLIENGTIQLSVFSNVSTYSEALQGFLKKDQWISSAWPSDKRRDLIKFFATCGPMVSTDWGETERLLYEGLSSIDGLRDTTAKLVPAQKPRSSFLQNMESYYSDLPSLVPDGLRPIAVNVRKLLESTRSYLSNEKIQDRSAWLTILGSEYFIETHEEYLGDGAWETAFLAVKNAYNDILCDSVANGVGLRSIAFRPLEDTNQFESFPLLPATQEYAHVNAHGEQQPAGIPIRSIIPAREQHKIESLNRVSWATINTVLADPRFRKYLRDAKGNMTARKNFLDWLSNKIGVLVASEYDAENRTTIKIGSRVLTGGALYAIGGAKLLFLETILYLFGHKTFSENIAKQLGSLTAKEVEWRVSGSMKNVFDVFADDRNARGRTKLISR